MSPLGKGLLTFALTMPLVVFVAGVLGSPDPVDPERSRPVIIGRVSDDKPTVDRTPTPPRQHERPDRAPGAEDDPAEEDVEEDVEEDPYTVVTPPPRDLDDNEDDRDDDDDDDTDDREGSRDD